MCWFCKCPPLLLPRLAATASQSTVPLPAKNRRQSRSRVVESRACKRPCEVRKDGGPSQTGSTRRRRRKQGGRRCVEVVSHKQRRASEMQRVACRELGRELGRWCRWRLRGETWLGSRAARAGATRRHVIPAATQCCLSGSRTFLFRKVCPNTVESGEEHFRRWKSCCSCVDTALWRHSFHNRGAKNCSK